MFRNALRNNTNKTEIRHFSFQNRVEKFIRKKKRKDYIVFFQQAESIYKAEPAFL
jgi:radical SAM superfamily enzyme